MLGALSASEPFRVLLEGAVSLCGEVSALLLRGIMRYCSVTYIEEVSVVSGSECDCVTHF